MLSRAAQQVSISVFEVRRIVSTWCIFSETLSNITSSITAKALAVFFHLAYLEDTNKLAASQWRLRESQMEQDRQQPPLPSPSPSSPSIAGPGTPTQSLPGTRLRPLKPASQKEIAFINYVDSKILKINRRFAKKFSSDQDESEEEARGYNGFQEVCDDLEQVFDAVWLSGTRE